MLCTHDSVLTRIGEVRKRKLCDGCEDLVVLWINIRNSGSNAQQDVEIMAKEHYTKRLRMGLSHKTRQLVRNHSPACLDLIRRVPQRSTAGPAY